MSKGRRVIVAVSAVVAIIIALMFSLSALREHNEALAPEVESIDGYSLQRGLTTEVLIDMGSVARSSTACYDIELHNDSDTTLLLLDYEATCRCVWMELPRKALLPNERATAKLWFDSRGEWGSIGNYIAVSTSLEDVAIAVWMCAEVE
jgi:hypothetical protein